MTHFACADDPNSDHFTEQQFTLFDQTVKQLKDATLTPNWIHAANSSASFRFTFSQYNMARIGIGIFGLHASAAVRRCIHLKPALSLLSRIVGINTLAVGESLSYGRTFIATRANQRIAILPIGYFDGLHLNYSGNSYVVIHGHKAPMVGKICMDFTMVDVSEIQNATVGDPVLIFGEDEHGHYLSPEELARQGNTIIHELITCLGPRIQRVFVL